MIDHLLAKWPHYGSRKQQTADNTTASIYEVPKLLSREQPKSAPYLRLKKTQKPLFLQLETTKALKKLKIEKKNPNFF